MKNINTYEQFNENILSRLSPKKWKNDIKATLLFDEIKADFEKYDRDLRKVSIFKDDIEKSFQKLEFGSRGRFAYCFGKYHPINNSTRTGNERIGNRKIEISYYNTRIDFKERDISIGESNVRDIRIVEDTSKSNRKYGPYSKSIEDFYNISKDISNKIVNYFIKEYDKKYPQLGKYKNVNYIDDIEDGMTPTVEYITGVDVNGQTVTDSLYAGENKEQLLKMMSIMPKEAYISGRYKVRTLDRRPLENKKREHIAKINKLVVDSITPLLKKYNIKEQSIGDIRIYRHEIQISLRIEKPYSEIENSIQKIVKQMPPIPTGNNYFYEVFKYHGNDSLFRSPGAMCFVTILLQNTEFKED